MLVYVGNLDRATTEKDIRTHLLNMQTHNVLDVINLKGKYSTRFASFCVSTSDENVISKVFEASRWPKGVIVRPFRPPRNRTAANWKGKPQQGIRRPRPTKSHNTRSTMTNRNQRGAWQNRFGVLQDDHPRSTYHENRDEWDYNRQGYHYDRYNGEYSGFHY
jgi:hypothetical protein